MHASIQQTSGNNFIDDNHDDILKSMDELTYLVRDNWNIDTFVNTVYDFINQLENHFSHEETILKGACFKNIEKHIIKHREDAINFLVIVRSMVFSHELIEDQSYWPLFGSESEPTIIPWSKDYETGNSDIDAHHQSLANYINRLNHKLS